MHHIPYHGPCTMYHGLVSRTVKRVEPVALIDLFLKVRALHPSTRQQFIQLCARTCFVGDVCPPSCRHLRAPRAHIYVQTSSRRHLRFNDHDISRNPTELAPPPSLTLPPADFRFNFGDVCNTSMLSYLGVMPRDGMLPAML